MTSVNVCVENATSDLLPAPLWDLNMELCDIINCDSRQAKDVVKAIKARLNHESSKVQYLTLVLLETLMKNCGDHVHREVHDRVLKEMVQIVKKKSDSEVRDKILVLIDSWNEAFGGATGKFHSAYSTLKGTIVDVNVAFQEMVNAARYRVENKEQICKHEKEEETKDKQKMEILNKEKEMLQRQLDFLQEENKKLLMERDNAVQEVKELSGSASRGSYIAFSEFSLSELQQATENFSNTNKIGEGGSGCVYKAMLHNTMVAIKILHPQSPQSRPEFEQEVTILSTVRHPNLVTLIGTCTENSALIYEYLPNGNLEDRLACHNGTPPLTWQIRTRIIGEVCRALLFLHSNNPTPIVHGDLKPSNILLDANLVSKISDFGISCPLIETNTNTVNYCTKDLRGTFAYMDPEFVSRGELTVKSDVYSFGIVILQLLTGKPPSIVVTDVEDAVENDSLHLMIDKSAGEWPFVQAKQLANLGLRCAQNRRRKRPDLESEWKLVESLTNAASLSVSPTFKSLLDGKGVPSYFICPIFQEVMKDPQVAADGYTYEAAAIKGWLDGGHNTSPMTNLPLLHHELTPNYALRSAIQEWLLEHP